MSKQEFIERAVELAGESMKKGGGPFGAVIVHKGKIIAEGMNRVTAELDPTAHAEVVAIRNAAKAIGDFRMDECEIYASCEPCPMCMSAIYWAHIPVLYYSASKEDAAEAGFDDKHIYEELRLDKDRREVRMTQLSPELAKNVFKTWNDTPDKTEY